MTENELSQLLFERLLGNQDIVDWLLAQTIFQSEKAILTPRARAGQWGYSSGQKRWWETDIFLLFERMVGQGRFALHIENKINAGFTENQAVNYGIRASEWKSRYDYDAFATILLAPASYIHKHPLEAEQFDCSITHEDVALHVVEFDPSHPLRKIRPSPKKEGVMKSTSVTLVGPVLEAFFIGSWETSTRIRTKPIGDVGGAQIREFEKARFQCRPDVVGGQAGFWVRLPISELQRRGISEHELGAWSIATESSTSSSGP